MGIERNGPLQPVCFVYLIEVPGNWPFVFSNFMHRYARE